MRMGPHRGSEPERRGGRAQPKMVEIKYGKGLRRPGGVSVKPAKKGTKSSGTRKAAAGEGAPGLSEGEKAALRETLQERRAAAEGKEDGESAVLAKIAEMREPDRTMAKRLHAIIKASAPNLSPKTWYGMPAYANQDGKVVVFFRNAGKFKERYATLGFNPEANLDEGAMWPIAFALRELTAADEARIAALVTRAVG